MKEFREFHYKDAHFRILGTRWDEITSCILEEREKLEVFLRAYPDFRTTLVPLDLGSESTFPESARRMQAASRATGLGPMAAVAGTMAQLAAEASRRSGGEDCIVENGGDIYLECREETVLGLYTGKNPHFQDLALRIPAEMMPLAVCSSSSRMGHSLSFGDCDLVTVFSKNASLADAAATLGGNSVKQEEDIEPVLNKLAAIPGIDGVLIIRDDRFGAVGSLPELVRSKDPALKAKVTRDDDSNF